MKFRKFYQGLSHLAGSSVNTYFWLICSSLIAACGLNATSDEAKQHSSCTTPEMYVHVDALNSKQVDVPAILHEAKERGLTAKDLIELKKIEIEAAKQKERQAFFTGVVYLGLPIIGVCCVAKMFNR